MQSFGGQQRFTMVYVKMVNTVLLFITSNVSMQNLKLLKFVLLVTPVSVNSHYGRHRWIRL